MFWRLGFGLSAVIFSVAAGEKGSDAALPQTVTVEHFNALFEKSPFTRTLNLSDSLVLSGIADMNGERVATVIDSADGRTMAVSKTPNTEGWRLVQFERPDDLESAIASIALDGGEIVRVYYDKERVEQASKLAARAARDRTVQFAGRMIARNVLPDWINEIQDPVKKGQAIAKFIEGGGFDKSPYDAVKMALSQSDPQARGTVMSAAFGRLGGGVGGTQINDAVNRLNSLENGCDRDFAINGLAHGLAGRDPKGALKWANSISNEGFRKVVVENVSRRINGQKNR
ncbi:MAG: hypothetical protein HKN23_06880 [Verrucomicrobiales bacterium]|nr:hypothetical protein [Verrucomicrobiales bacterium]